MRKSVPFVMLLGCFALLPNFATAQQGDAMIGFGTLMAPGADPCNTTTLPVLKRADSMNLGADVILHRRIGFGFDATWKAGQGSYGGPGGQPFRPILFDFNGVYQPKWVRRPDLI